MQPAGDILYITPHPLCDSRRLWSLWDMINFQLGPFWRGLEYLQHDLQRAQFAADRGDGIVPKADRLILQGTIAYINKECVAALQLTSADRISVKLEDLFRREFQWSELVALLVRLKEEIEHELQFEHFFHYPRTMVNQVLFLDREWRGVVEPFPSSRREIVAGLDCVALQDYSGCVFHMMRVAELGLRHIAKERGVKTVAKNKALEWGTWKDVFDAIEVQLKIIRSKPGGPKRDKALNFYDAALSDLRTLQGLYRDPTMHFRERYDPGEAQSAMFRVKSLMQMLGTKLKEDRVRKIAWGL